MITVDAQILVTCVDYTYSGVWVNMINVASFVNKHNLHLLCIMV